jgi:hypothetical protein
MRDCHSARRMTLRHTPDETRGNYLLASAQSRQRLLSECVARVAHVTPKETPVHRWRRVPAFSSTHYGNASMADLSGVR